jgi:thiol-disulfide isomerase/thioredoxin
VGKPYPNFSIHGSSPVISDSTLHRKVVFINFWFANCVPCIAEFEALNGLYEKLKGKKDIVFFVVDF